MTGNNLICVQISRAGRFGSVGLARCGKKANRTESTTYLDTKYKFHIILTYIFRKSIHDGDYTFMTFIFRPVLTPTSSN